MAFWDKIWDALTSAVPLDRWIRAIENVLKFLGTAFVLVAILMLPLIVAPCGFTPSQRVGLIVGFMVLMVFVLIVCALLALLPGGALYSPYERSLRRGRRYGTRLKPLTKKEVEALLEEAKMAGLPSPGDTEEGMKQLPPGESKR